MAKPLHRPGVILDGFRLEEMAHQDGMATVWRVTHPGMTTPILVKVPRIGEGTDPAAAILKFAQANSIDHILIGARQNSLMRKLLGSVSVEVAAEAR